MITPDEKMKILALARKILSNERTAVQNQEAGHEKAVYRYQGLADEAMTNLERYLEGAGA